MKASKPNNSQKALLRKRGLDPNSFLVIRALYGCVWFLNRSTGKVLIVNKHN